MFSYIVNADLGVSTSTEVMSRMMKKTYMKTLQTPPELLKWDNKSY